MNESEQIIDLIAKQTKILIANHWPDIDEFRDDDEKIKVAFSHQISYQLGKRLVESTISFGKRMRDTLAEDFETQQIKVDFGTGEPNFKRRGRPPGKPDNSQTASSRLGAS